MNLLALLAGLLPWAPTPGSAFTRIYLACGLFSVEAQLVTWLGRGSLDGLLPFNIVLAVLLMVWQIRRGTTRWVWVKGTLAVTPAPVLAALFAVVVFLNLWRPVEAADHYQLERVLQIERLGSLAYSTALDAKANILGAFYELVLADLQSLPVVGAWLVRLHGVLGLTIFTLAVATVQQWLPFGRSIRARSLLFVVPVVFNQLVLIKNDLFIAAPAFVALAWALGDADRSRLDDVWRAGCLTGLIVAAKLTNAAVAGVVALSVLVQTRAMKPLLTLGVAILVGILAGGLALTFWQNARVYGDPFAAKQVQAIGSVNLTPRESAVGLGRFAISLFDLGLITRDAWPGRGGWGGTFGVPFVWAMAVLVASWRMPEARRALLGGGLCLLALGVTFPDADLSHRLVLGPGLLVIAAAISLSRSSHARWVSLSLTAALLLSAGQIVRSAVLYLSRV